MSVRIGDASSDRTQEAASESWSCYLFRAALSSMFPPRSLTSSPKPSVVLHAAMNVSDSISIVRWMTASTRLVARDVELSVVAVIGRSVDDNALSFITNLSFECGRARDIHDATTRRGERDDPEHATSLAPA